MLEWKLEVWGWFSLPPPDMKSQSITRDGCICLLLDLLDFSKISSKRETAVVRHAEGFIVWGLLWNKNPVILVTFFLHFLEAEEAIRLHWHWGTAQRGEVASLIGIISMVHNAAEVLLHQEPLRPLPGGCQTHSCKPCTRERAFARWDPSISAFSGTCHVCTGAGSRVLVSRSPVVSTAKAISPVRGWCGCMVHNQSWLSPNWRRVQASRVHVSSLHPSVCACVCVHAPGDWLFSCITKVLCQKGRGVWPWDRHT